MLCNITNNLIVKSNIDSNIDSNIEVTMMDHHYFVKKNTYTDCQR